MTPVEQAIRLKKISSNRKVRSKRQPRQRSPKRIEEEYQRKLKCIFNNMLNCIRENVINNLEDLTDEAKSEKIKIDSFRYDNLTEKLTSLFKATRAAVSIDAGEKQLTAAAQEFAEKTNSMSRKNFIKSVKKGIGIDLFAEEPFILDSMSMFVANNVNLITNVQNQFMSEVENIVFDGVQRGVRPEILKNKILARVKDKEGFKGRFKKSITRANLIARDQVTKLNGALNKSRQETVGIKKYIWRTTRDDRVRDDHKLEGEVFSYGKGKSESGKSKPKGSLDPGEDIQCRCYAEPFFDDLLD